MTWAAWSLDGRAWVQPPPTARPTLGSRWVVLPVFLRNVSDEDVCVEIAHHCRECSRTMASSILSILTGLRLRSRSIPRAA